VHLAYIWIVSHLSAKNYRNWWKYDEVLTKTNMLSFLGHGVHQGWRKVVKTEDARRASDEDAEWRRRHEN